jgi:hypothetical protein
MIRLRSESKAKPKLKTQKVKSHFPVEPAAHTDACYPTNALQQKQVITIFIPLSL